MTGDIPFVDKKTCTPCEEGRVIKGGKCELCPEDFFFKNHVCYRMLYDILYVVVPTQVDAGAALKGFRAGNQAN